METTIIVALIGAAGLVLAAVLPILLQRKPKEPVKPEPPAPVTQAPVLGDLERALRADDRVKRLLGNKGWKDAAEAAIAFLCRGVPSATWQETSTWKQVQAVHAELSNSTTTRSMDWEQLLAALQRSLAPGQITTYGECSQWANGHRRGSPSIVAMLNAMARRGHRVWSNRVVQDDGGIADPPDTGYGQRGQLQAEGVPFNADRVNLTLCPTVALH